MPFFEYRSTNKGYPRLPDGQGTMMKKIPLRNFYIECSFLVFAA